jgi:Protein of unknown function (DUF3240)
MSTNTFSSFLVTINVPPALEERVVDWLLEREDAPGFTSYIANGHGANHEHLSLAEQVSGRQRRIEFRVEVPSDTLDAFVAALSAAFGGADVYYFVLPVNRSGHLREIAL